jgi:hypothetical protein
MTKKQLRRFIRHSRYRSFSSTIENLIYLNDDDTGTIAEEATHRLHIQLSKLDLEPNSKIKLFYQLTLTEALGYFGAKLIDASTTPESREEALVVLREESARRCDKFLTIQEQVTKSEDVPEHLVSQFDELFPSIFEETDCLTHYLGSLLGEELYRAVDSGRKPISEVRKLFSTQYIEEGSAFLNYDRLWRELRG